MRAIALPNSAVEICRTRAAELCNHANRRVGSFAPRFGPSAREETIARLRTGKAGRARYDHLVTERPDLPRAARKLEMHHARRIQRHAHAGRSRAQTH